MKSTKKSSNKSSSRTLIKLNAYRSENRVKATDLKRNPNTSNSYRSEESQNKSKKWMNLQSEAENLWSKPEKLRSPTTAPVTFLQNLTGKKKSDYNV